jgi:acyl carrier protein
MSDVEGRIRSVFCEVFDLQPEEVGATTSTDTIEGWDSLQHFTLVVALEEEFEIGFSDEETVTLVNFPLIAAVVEEHLQGP